jgi:hypothetical protein
MRRHEFIRCLSRAITIASCLAALAASPATTQSILQPVPPKADERSFELQAVAPPVPAGKYQLACDPLDELPGNAAIAYLQASIWLTNDLKKSLDSAEEANDSHDEKAFEASAASLTLPGLSSQLEIAARRDVCDFECATQQTGGLTLLPHLNKLRTLGEFLVLRAQFQMRGGQPAEAVKTLQLGYALARHTGQERFEVSGMVGEGLTVAANNALAELMNRPDAPNLYWAIAGLPHPLARLATGVEGHRVVPLVDFPVLKKGRGGNIVAGDWRLFMDEKAAYETALRPEEAIALRVTDASAAAAAHALLPGAIAYYAQSRHVSPEQAATLDPALLAATYVIEQFQADSDEYYMMANLPYPQLLPLAKKLTQRLNETKASQAAGLWNQSFDRRVMVYARTDRQLAALGAVEAIRSFAAAHNGQLPQSLNAIVDTPAPLNPATGVAFEYHVEGNVATLSDHSEGMGDFTLDYTVRIRPR